MTFTCARCGAVDAEAGNYCRECGAPRASASVSASAPAAPAGREGRVDMTIAVLALVLNLFVLPGLGSVIAGAREGWWQLGLFLLAFALGGFGVLVALFAVGPPLAILALFLVVPLAVAAWIWGIVTGVRLIRAA